MHTLTWGSFLLLSKKDCGGGPGGEGHSKDIYEPVNSHSDLYEESVVVAACDIEVPVVFCFCCCCCCWA